MMPLYFLSFFRKITLKCCFKKFIDLFSHVCYNIIVIREEPEKIKKRVGWLCQLIS